MCRQILGATGLLSPPLASPSVVRPLVCAAVIAIALSAAVPASTAPPEPTTPPDESDLQIVAAAVRVTGALCNQARDIKRDPVASLPERQAWIIRCENGSFRVIFEGDTGPHVTPLE
ncbi:MAG: hypothetical protein IPK78_12920 [Rhodospirillales bacterium]|nr:hypothetical protein [Rhodospirillales bacterium]